jgi:glycerol-3-phosphate dehydrogenase (NAD(P)+)
MKVAVLGAGAWGTALAQLLAEKGDEVVLWARRRELCEAVNAARENARYLPGIELSESVHATESIPAALHGAEMVVFVVPSHATREVAREAAPYVGAGVPIVSATKGIENDSLMFMDEVLAEELPPHCRRALTFLSGPSFARELAHHLPTAVVIAAHDAGVGSRVMHAFHTHYLRTYASDDVAGVECGGALKNVIAIAAGIAVGVGLGYNSSAALITRGIVEITRLAVACGARRETLAGLSGVGDLVLTCTGSLSRNRTVGQQLGEGRKLPEILESLGGKVAEGVLTTRAALGLARKHGVEMPIAEQMELILTEGKDPREAIRSLMLRPGKEEH